MAGVNFVPQNPDTEGDVFDRVGRMKRDGPGYQYVGNQVYSGQRLDGLPYRVPPVTKKPAQDRTPRRVSPSRPKPPAQSGPGYLGNLSGEDRDAAAALIELFRQYGLETLAPKIVDYVKKGYGSDTIALLLQDSPEWKQRFAANETRRKAGMPVLSPAEYLSVERSYRQVMSQYGMPKGFYDSYSDFQKFIANDMSATELQGRVQIATAWANNQDSATKTALRKLYGIGNSELAAYALDQNRALPLLERQAKAVAIASEAQRQGLGYSKAKSEYFADLGITQDAARQGYGTIAEILPVYNQLGKIYSESYTQATAEAEVFEGSGKATTKRKKLESQERATFGGSSRGNVGRGTGSY